VGTSTVVTDAAPALRTRPAIAAADEVGAVADRVLPQRPFAVRFWDGSELPATVGRAVATVVVRSPRALARILRAPDQLGLGRAWVAGELDVDGDPEAILARREELAAGARPLGAATKLRALRAAQRLGVPLLRTPRPPAAEARFGGRLHSLRRDRSAVRFHYDVSNRFYGMVLGPSMVYSCAYFANPGETLETAQERKLDVVCRKLALEPGERVLDVGCGWGSLLIHAARRYGVQAVGVTLSPLQAELARERVREAGLDGRVEIRVQDYREVSDGPYDKVASIGMYEHVGRAQLGAYCTQLSALTRPGGLVLNHGITRLKAVAPNDRSFIARFVFPDGELHPLDAVLTELRVADLEVRDVESLREHYPLTLRRWVANLERHRAEAIAEAGSERERVWRLYMSASALSFEAGDIGVFQVVAAKPGAPHRLPLARQGG
jgi:cyclopropane-fatty-acyl-phospholipid synthase